MVLRVARSSPVVPHTVVTLVLTLLQLPKEIGGAGRDHDLQPPFGPDHLLVQLRYVHVGAPRISINLMSVVYIIYFTPLTEDPYNNNNNNVFYFPSDKHYRIKKRTKQVENCTAWVSFFLQHYNSLTEIIHTGGYFLKYLFNRPVR